MSNSVNFFQTICKGTLRVVGSTSSVSFCIESGKCSDAGNHLVACDSRPDKDIVKMLWNANIFSRTDQIASIGNKLLALSKSIEKRGNALSVQVMQQSEFVKSKINGASIEDIRRWNMGRVVITTPQGFTTYRDVSFMPETREIVNQVESSVYTILEELGDSKFDRPDTIPISPLSVIFSPGAGGFFTHEVFGHMLEGDFVSKGFSLFGMNYSVNSKIGPDVLNIVDDPSGHQDQIGLNMYDDEGEKLTKIDLVSRGVLNSYICNREAARYFGGDSKPGCSRRQSYKHKAIPRMRATYILPNSNGSNLLEIIAHTDIGIWVKQLSGGNVNTLTGDFMLLCNLAYLVHDGKITNTYRDLLLFGNVLEVLGAIDTIGNDLEILPLQCSKAGQIIPVCAGSPSLRTHGIKVGRKHNGGKIT